MNRIRRQVQLVVSLLALSIIASALVGCGLLSREPLTVPDPEGLYHMNVPSDWTFSSKPGMVSVYADDKVPEDGSLEELSMVIMTSTLGTAEETPEPADALKDFAQWRSKDRKWKSPKMGAVKKTKLGAKPASYMDVSGVDQGGNEFNGRYYLARTAKKEVFILAVAPATEWDSAVKQLDETLADEWYWHDTK